MAHFGLSESKLTTFIPVIFEKGVRARRIISRIREEHGIQDSIHGKIKDTRPLPSAPLLTFSIMLDGVERTIRNIVNWY